MLVLGTIKMFKRLFWTTEKFTNRAQKIIIMTTKITLQCVAQGSKLRIRFHSYTNEEGKTFTNVYDNSYNCQFPRAIREVGRYYEINPSDLILVGGDNGKSPFYRVPKNNIKVLSREEGLRYEEAFRAGELNELLNH